MGFLGFFCGFFIANPYRRRRTRVAAAAGRAAAAAGGKVVAAAIPRTMRTMMR